MHDFGHRSLSTGVGRTHLRVFAFEPGADYTRPISDLDWIPLVEYARHHLVNFE